MATVRKCYQGDCECNVDGCYCDAYEVIIGTNGDCLTYCQKSEVNTNGYSINN
jgi:hypothetical protein